MFLFNFTRKVIILTALLFIVVISQISCQQKTETELSTSEPIVDSVASADGVMIYYETVGQGEPALVFVHGGSCNRTYWREQVDIFSKSNEVITIDLGGHGQSGTNRDNWTMAAFGNDVIAVINKLNLQKMILIGHSFGGSVNIVAAKLFPDRVIGLIGVDTFKGFSAGYPKEDIDNYLLEFASDYHNNMEQRIRGMFHEQADSALVQWVVDDMCSAPQDVALSLMSNFFTWNAQEALKEVNIPVRAVNSDKHPTNVEENQKHTESFEVKLMSGVSHFNQLEDPETFNRLLQETINELTGKTDKTGDED